MYINSKVKMMNKRREQKIQQLYHIVKIVPKKEINKNAK